ncbi:MAG: hypothetical protein HY722_07660 [Planctomycetes bacterium]|nr:hypothetical protein [Planctomycetota bacterium]
MYASKSDVIAFGVAFGLGLGGLGSAIAEDPPAGVPEAPERIPVDGQVLEALDLFRGRVLSLGALGAVGEPTEWRSPEGHAVTARLESGPEGLVVVLEVSPSRVGEEAATLDGQLVVSRMAGGETRMGPRPVEAYRETIHRDLAGGAPVEIRVGVPLDPAGPWAVALEDQDAGYWLVFLQRPEAAEADEAEVPAPVLVARGRPEAADADRP